MPVDPLDFAPLDTPTASQMDRLAEAAQPWATYTPTVVNVTTASVQARYLRHGDKVTVRFRIGLSAAPTGTVTISLPVAASTTLSPGLEAALGTVSGLRQGVGYYTGVVSLASSTTVSFTSGDGDALGWRNAVPAAWATTDIWGGTFTYEAA